MLISKIRAIQTVNKEIQGRIELWRSEEIVTRSYSLSRQDDEFKLVEVVKVKYGDQLVAAFRVEGLPWEADPEMNLFNDNLRQPTTFNDLVVLNEVQFFLTLLEAAQYR